MLRQSTIEWGDLKATVQEQSGLQAFTERETFLRILSVLRGEKVVEFDDSISTREDMFMLMVSRTTTVEGFKFADSTSSDKAIKDAYKTLEMLPGGFVRSWYGKILDLNQAPIGDPDLVPPEQLTDAQKKIEE